MLAGPSLPQWGFYDYYNRCGSGENRYGREESGRCPGPTGETVVPDAFGSVRRKGPWEAVSDTVLVLTPNPYLSKDGLARRE
jgi:hypothetical protein